MLHFSNALRNVCILTVILATASHAAAVNVTLDPFPPRPLVDSPIVEVSEGPCGIVLGPPCAPNAYRIWIVVSTPSPPGSRPQNPDTDCAYGNHPNNTVDAAARVLEPMDETIEDYLANPHGLPLGGLVPTCIAGPTLCVGGLCAPYVDYNVATGGYCVIDDPICGDSGIEIKADCEPCDFPPP